MRRRPLIGLAGRAEHDDVTQDHEERRERHHDGDQRRRSRQRGEVQLGFHRRSQAAGFSGRRAPMG